MNSRRFEGRTAIVTGGASGIGGAKVNLWDLNQAGLAEAAAEMNAAHRVALDVTDSDQVVQAMGENCFGSGQDRHPACKRGIYRSEHDLLRLQSSFAQSSILWVRSICRLRNVQLTTSALLDDLRDYKSLDLRGVGRGGGDRTHHPPCEEDGAQALLDG